MRSFSFGNHISKVKIRFPREDPEAIPAACVEWLHSITVSAGAFSRIQCRRVHSFSDPIVYSKLIVFIFTWVNYTKENLCKVKGLFYCLGFWYSFLVNIFVYAFVCSYVFSIFLLECCCVTFICLVTWLVVRFFFFLCVRVLSFTFEFVYVSCWFLFLFFSIFSHPQDLLISKLKNKVMFCRCRKVQLLCPAQ